jgi:small redox-active disulfide protein 2
MKIEVLGTGCEKCKKTYANARQAVEALGVEADLVKIEKIQDIVERGVMVTPALSVDGEVKVAGRVPSTDEIKGWLAAKA